MVMWVKILFIRRYFSFYYDVYLSTKRDDAQSNSTNENSDDNCRTGYHLCVYCIITRKTEQKERGSGERKKSLLEFNSSLGKLSIFVVIFAVNKPILTIN